MVTAHTRVPVRGVTPRDRLPNLFCRSAATGEFLWSRGDGLPQYTPGSARYELDGTCGDITHNGSGANLIIVPPGLRHIHTAGNYVFCVTGRGDGITGETIGRRTPLVTVRTLDGDLVRAVRLGDFGDGQTQPLVAASRSGAVWIHLQAEGIKLLCVTADGAVYRNNVTFLDGPHGPMIRPDGTAYVTDSLGFQMGTSIGVMAPNGDIVWSRSDLLGQPGTIDYSMLPNGNLLVDMPYFPPNANSEWQSRQLQIVDGSSGQTIAISGRGTATYWWTGDAGYWILPDGRIPFAFMDTRRVVGYGYDGVPVAYFPVNPPPLWGQTPTIPEFHHPLFHSIHGILGADLTVIDFRQDGGYEVWESMVGEESDLPPVSFSSLDVGQKTTVIGNIPVFNWNDAGFPLLGSWPSEVTIPPAVSVEWRIGEDLAQAQLPRPLLRGEPGYVASRDGGGNWYSPGLLQLMPGESPVKHIKSVDALGGERWRVDLGWDSGLQMGAQCVAVSDDGSKVFYLT